MNYDFNNYKDNALTKPRDLAWENWVKWETVGQKVQGFIRDVFYRAAEGQYAEQRGLTLEQANGEMINVGIKRRDFILAKTDNLRLGDPLTIEFDKEIPSKTKGYNATKSFAFYGTSLPENTGNKTVLELENEDRKIVAEEAAQQQAEADAEMNAMVAPTPVAPVEETVATATGDPLDGPATA